MKTLTRKDTCSPIFIAALFTIAKIWKQLKCPSGDEWLNKLWCVCVCILLYTIMHIIVNIILHKYYIYNINVMECYTMEYVCVCVMECDSAIKKNDIFPFVTTWIDPEGIVFV